MQCSCATLLLGTHANSQPRVRPASLTAGTTTYIGQSGASTNGSVLIVWANKGETPPDWSAFPRVVTVVQETDDLVTRTTGRLPIDFSLNNRFRPYSSIRTLAVFSVDNDMLVNMKYMDFCFESWRLVKHSIVGFAIRVAKKSIEEKWSGLYEAHCEYTHWVCRIAQFIRMGLFLWSAWFDCRLTMLGLTSIGLGPGWSAGNVPGHKLEYNLVYTNAAIFHRELLNAYTCEMPPAVREMVSTIRSCEDIAMNILSYAKWGAQPLGVTTAHRCVDNYGIAPK